jgi:hypothetical protein
MVSFQIESEKVKEWFPETYKSFIEDLRNSKSQSKDTKEENMEWYIIWGFFTKKAKTESEIEEQSERIAKRMEMVFSDRLNAELPKIRCSLDMKAGYYYRTDRVQEKEVPQFINDMAIDIVKWMIFQEQQWLNNEVVIDSIRDFYDDVMYYINSDRVDESENLNMDSILDKINESGMSSLTPIELDFLEKSSNSK